MVAEGWSHSCQSSPGLATPEALRASKPHVRLSKREVRYSFMVSWTDGQMDTLSPHSGWEVLGSPWSPMSSHSPWRP